MTIICSVSVRKCPQCNDTFKTAKPLLHHIKTKHVTCETISSSNGTEPPEVLQEGLTGTTQIELVEPPVLCLEHVGQTSQQISPLGVDQIKKLIEQFGNVKKVNQLVIYGVDQNQAQNLGVQQSQGLLQPLHFDFSEPTLQTIDVQQPDDGSVYESTVSTVTEHVTTVESVEPRCAAEQDETSILEEAAMVSSEYQEKQVSTAESNMTEMQSNEIHEVLPEQIEKTDPASQASFVLLCSKEGQDVVVASSFETPGKGNALSSLAECEIRQTIANDVSKSADIFDLCSTYSKEDLVVEHLDQNSEGTVPLLEPKLQAGQENRDDFDITPKSVPLPDQLDQTPSESVKSQIAERSLIDVHHDQDRPPLEEAPSSEAELLQSTLTSEEQDLSGPKNSKYVKRALPMKKTSKRQTPPKDKAGLKKSQITSAQKNSTGSKASKKQETIKSKKLLVRFGPTQNKEKLSKRKLLQISKPNIYRDQHEIVPALSKKKSQLKQKKKKQKNEKGKRTKKSALINSLNFSLDPKLMKVPEQTHRRKPKKRELESPKELLKERKPAQETQQDEPPVPKKKKHSKISVTPSKKNAKVNQAKSKAKRKGHKLEKQTENDQNVSLPTTMDQFKKAALLLLKGHKQPQLKVHKLDAKTTGMCQTKEVTNQPTTEPAIKGAQNKSPKTTSQKRGKSIGKKSKKVQNESSKLQVFPVYNLPLGEKQKAVRKRKACTKIDQEIALSPPYSRVTIGCHDCGKHFSEVSALQEHMASIHSETAVIQSSMAYDVSPDLSFNSKDTIPVNANHSRRFETQMSSDWEVESELREIGLNDRGDHRLSFPALSPSPSFPLIKIPVGHSEDGLFQATHLENSEELGENSRDVQLTQMSFTKAPTSHNELTTNTRVYEDTEMQSVSDSQENMDVKGELSLDLNVVMVEEPNEVDAQVSTQVNDSHETPVQKKDKPNSSGVNHMPAQEQSSAKTVNSSSTQHSEQPEVKQEVGDLAIQKIRSLGVARGRRRGGRGRGKRQSVGNRVVKEIVANDEDCRVVYELYSLTDNQDARTENMNKKTKSNNATVSLEETNGSQIQKPAEEDENTDSGRGSSLSPVHHQTEMMREVINYC